MKILPQRHTFFHGRMKPLGTVSDWQGKIQAGKIASTQSFERIMDIGLTTEMDDYEKRKLRIFNQLNFLQLVTGIVVPVIGAIGNHHFPLTAWLVACLAPLARVLVLA